MAILNGTLIKLYDGSTPIALLTSSDLTLEREMLDVTNKDSDNWKEVIAGNRSFSFSGEIFNDPAETYNLEDLYTKWEAGTEITMKLSSEVTGQKKFTGAVLINNIAIATPQGQPSTVSVEFTGTGPLVMATI
jgi:predicted secreted protein